MIVRAKRITNYTIMSNVGLDDSRLSWKAKGMLAYLLSKPDDWQVSDRHLATVGPDGRAAGQAALKELETFGYLERKRVREDDGTFTWHSTIYDEPRLGYPATVEPATVQPATDNRAKVITDVVSTERTITERTSKGEVVAAPTTPQQEMFGAVCEAIGWDYKVLVQTDKAQVAQAVTILNKANYQVEDIRRFMVDVWFKDWRWVKDASHPTLKQLRQEIGKIRSTVPLAAPPPKTKGMTQYREMLARQGITYD